MAIYVRAKGPGIDQEIFRWNNGNAKVNEVNSYGLDNSPGPTEVTLQISGPKAIIVNPVPGIQVGGYVENCGIDLYRLAKEKGLEGIIAKRKPALTDLESDHRIG
jgi:hypothetical protein